MVRSAENLAPIEVSTHLERAPDTHTHTHSQIGAIIFIYFFLAWPTNPPPFLENRWQPTRTLEEPETLHSNPSSG